MANPTLIKIAIGLLKDENVRKKVLLFIGIALSPLILIIVVIMSMGSGTASHNQRAIVLCFNDEEIDKNIPEEYKIYIENMRNHFKEIDLVIEKLKNENKVEEIDDIRIKSVFFSLFFEEIEEIPSYEEFVKRFLKEENNEDDEKIKYIMLKDLTEVYKNLRERLNLTITVESMANGREIYYRIKYGVGMPTEVDSSEEWEGWKPQLTPEEMEDLYNKLPPNELGSEVLKKAMSRLGHPYSQEKRGQGNYVDCSYLTMWSYRQVGINIPATAASQAKWCVDNKLTIAKSDLQIGDLVFWSYEPNGRFMNIGHVGIYAGDGKVVDASSTKKQVVYRNLFDSNKQVLYGRPLKIKKF